MVIPSDRIGETGNQKIILYLKYDNYVGTELQNEIVYEKTINCFILYPILLFLFIKFLKTKVISCYVSSLHFVICLTVDHH